MILGGFLAFNYHHDSHNVISKFNSNFVYWKVLLVLNWSGSSIYCGTMSLIDPVLLLLMQNYCRTKSKCPYKIYGVWKSQTARPCSSLAVAGRSKSVDFGGTRGNTECQWARFLCGSSACPKRNLRSLEQYFSHSEAGFEETSYHKNTFLSLFQTLHHPHFSVHPNFNFSQEQFNWRSFGGGGGANSVNFLRVFWFPPEYT